MRPGARWKTLLGLVTVLLLASPAFAQKPGGVTTNLKLWLKADVGIAPATNGAVVSSWGDQNGSLNATQTNNNLRPLYKDGANGINFNPSVTFDGSNDYLGGTGGFYSQQYYVVTLNRDLINSNSAGQTVFSGSHPDAVSDVSGFHFGNVTARFNNEVVSHNISNTNEWGSALNSTTASLPANSVNVFSVQNNAANNGTDIFQNATKINNLSANTFSSLSNTAYKLGTRRDPANPFDGEIAEVITYSARNSDADKAKIESYLAIKYGATLTGNYVSSTGALIWNGTANAAYQNDIAGIAQDNASGLLQKQSRANGFQPLAIGLANVAQSNLLNTSTFAADQKFLLWGHNNQATTITTAVKPQVRRMARIWKVSNVNNVAAVMVRIDGSFFTGPVTDTPVLIISTDPTFDASDQVIELDRQGTFQRKLANLPDGAYFTFGIQTLPPLLIPISFTKN